jgi:F-type H+-transporting ATPase subunit epsilon
MSDALINFTLVSPERLVLAEKVDMVVIPGEAGDFGVLPNHAALISSLRPGLITVYTGATKRYIFVSHGFANVSEEGCVVLAEECEFVKDMSLDELKAHAQRLKEKIESARTEQEMQDLKRNHELVLLKMGFIQKLM